jgi:tripartite-type tricarboxylate transporter receptor subunit TctC
VKDHILSTAVSTICVVKLRLSRPHRRNVVTAMTKPLICVAALLLAGNSYAHAQTRAYPDRPVRIIVPFAPAGPVDVVARLIAQKLSENLGKQFIVENQAGAGGNLGMGNAARAVPDGYTILFVSSSYVVNPSLYRSVPYDPVRDFTPITIAGSVPNALAVHPSVPAKTVKELVDLVKANPGKYSYSSAGIGTTPHLSGELFRLSAAIDLVHVPFNGAGPAVQSAVGGHTPVMFTALTPAVGMIRESKLRALAVTSKARSPAVPDVPTLEEAGYKDQEAETFVAAFVPAATPKPIADLLHREIVKILRTQEIKARMDQLGMDIVANSPEQFAAQIKAEIAKWSKVIKDANIKAE